MDELLSSADAAADAAELSARLVKDGYVYLPGYLPADEVAAVQAAVRHALYGEQWLAAPDTLRLRTDRPTNFTKESFATTYPAVQRLEVFHQLAHHERILHLMSELLADDIFCHPAKVCRLATSTRSADQYATRAHQDFVVLHTSADVLTAWIPLTPCSPENQGLRVLRNSHLDGFVPTRAAVGGARPLYLPVVVDDPRWMTADYRLGDLVVFHSLTIHGGGPNITGDIRLSADVRYQRRGESMRAEFAHPHGWPRTPDWDRICQGWTSRAWTEVPEDVVLVPFPGDLSYGDYLATLTAPYSRLLGR
ncbi:phytanoyl-CoA dioxygenase family protein [Streptomyces canus]|jgi:ectoine hydroxylase-related dioxygenase (phytanoyl-CoA dioxygenase family)|uniref:phytanoyl-CoA dioxygenase family protein n=1 Tax=Streptomyces sp. SAI-144 TaxID=2940544 RepID=UPI002476971E|nr:phytanoyl-CoA dioxygenase family protein [Streptomyces sp. SAI-144]MDH6435684.1 ectoine hydroxylase-related dioxygenase (phytanoyl-CoA dioxygenase family) [Streptomyces sp. SAI-144]